MYNENNSSPLQTVKYTYFPDGQIHMTLTFSRSQFLAKKDKDAFFIHFALKITLFKSLQKSQLLDTLSTFYRYRQDSLLPFFDVFLRKQLNQAIPAFALIEIEDVERKVKYQELVEIDTLFPLVEKKAFYQRGNVSVIKLGDTITFETPIPFSELQLAYYQFSDFFPPPPYVEFVDFVQYKQVLDLSLLAVDSGKFAFVPSQRGFYVLQQRGTNRKYFWYVGSTHFPQVVSYDDMLYPLRYITSENEFKKMLQNPREEVERFWLRIGGTEQLARQLIRKYYHRVRRANELFTSYVEGWRTDRGMIYVVMGKPTSVYRNDSVEIWTYGQENHMMSMQFLFNKKEILPGFYDFVLERNYRYRDFWFNMVEIWRR